MSVGPISAVIDEQPVEATVEAVPIYADVVVGGPKGDTGDSGPQGPQGQQGPAGPGGQAVQFDQSTPSTVWTWVHNLGVRWPPVTTIDGAGSLIIGDVNSPDVNTVTITFSTPESGKAYITL